MACPVRRAMPSMRHRQAVRQRTLTPPSQVRLLLAQLDKTPHGCLEHQVSMRGFFVSAFRRIKKRAFPFWGKPFCRLSKKSRPADMCGWTGHIQGNLALRVCEAVRPSARFSGKFCPQGAAAPSASSGRSSEGAAGAALRFSQAGTAPRRENRLSARGGGRTKQPACFWRSAKKYPRRRVPSRILRWSCYPDLNWRPHPYQGCALPTEL